PTTSLGRSRLNCGVTVSPLVWRSADATPRARSALSTAAISRLFSPVASAAVALCVCTPTDTYATSGAPLASPSPTTLTVGGPTLDAGVCAAAGCADSTASAAATSHVAIGRAKRRTRPCIGHTPPRQQPLASAHPLWLPLSQ